MKITTKITYDKDGRKVIEPIILQYETGVIYRREYDCKVTLSIEEAKFNESPLGKELLDE